ncbi:BMP family ABC transporter substrate-binding protein [Variovorax ginsengisoli]|jgi:simple sugar transport system substrate-binding protein|uniref:BMP family ABC transporter substrate-binding protein n=1 Tax=Variovorax ginsengisoli TaxID=363844 RepID=A0ABT8SBX5_9BURK|nr:BMP family ABC transporter substrate-binding protein [Variovorax ginsengisoli]MDN8617254.1 BMP family ABC transporter substrate-binding protein [Variovorax ginsengisoli]MDO1536424.1 BMP family ABC transporter substrate-binding protein [Variovorax ginsengisoli]
MSNTSWNRRRFLGTTLGSAVGSTLAGSAVAPALFGAAAAQAQAKGVTVGLIYVGPRGDYGWNQAHAVAAQALKSVPGVKVVEEENVPETVAVRKTIEGMIQSDGASLVFGTSFGYFDPFMVEMAKKYPKVEFRHPTSLWSPDKHPMNLGGYFCYLDQAHYVNGIAAGLSTRTNKIGYVAAKPIAIVLRNINSFAMGVRKVNPNAVVQLVFTGEWSMPVREGEATNALIAAGNDVIACHVDSPKVVIETAEKAGAKTLGHNASQAQLAPKGFITGAENKWETVYKSFAADVGAGKKLPNQFFGGYDKDMVLSTPFGAGASEQARNAATAAIAELKAGKPIWTGPVKSNSGKVVLDKGYGNYDPVLEKMDYLVEGVAGTLG